MLPVWWEGDAPTAHGRAPPDTAPRRTKGLGFWLAVVVMHVELRRERQLVKCVPLGSVFRQSFTIHALDHYKNGKINLRFTQPLLMLMYWMH